MKLLTFILALVSPAVLFAEETSPKASRDTAVVFQVASQDDGATTSVGSASGRAEAETAMVSGFPPPPKAAARLAEARFAREGGSRTQLSALSRTWFSGLDRTGPAMSLPEQPRVAAAQQPALPRLGEGPRRRPSMVGYVNDATIGSQVRFRLDRGRNITAPDRAEFFYAKCGCYRDLPIGHPARDPDAPGPGPGIVEELDFQQLYFQAELAVVPDRVSLFAEVPFRWVQPVDFVIGTGSFPDQSGLADIHAGVKIAAVSTENQFVTFMFQFGSPTGDALKGLGTDHWSMEPAVLFYTRAGERVALEGQFGGVIARGGSAGLPTSSSDKFAGNVLYYGIGPSVEIYSSDTVRIAPVIELVGWRVLSGFQTALIADASDINIVNVKVGARFVFQDRNSFYVGYGHKLTDEFWYEDIFRAEFRTRF